MPNGPCQHMWIDAANSIIKSGWICLHCGDIEWEKPMKGEFYQGPRFDLAEHFKQLGITHMTVRKKRDD